MTLPLAADPGFAFADPYAVLLLFVGVAFAAAVGALSHQRDRAFSASVIYLGLGAVAAVAMGVAGVVPLDPIADASLFQRASELAVIIALFGTGLKLERELTFRAWTAPTRLLAIAMPLTILGVAAFGNLVMGLSVGAAIILGACLAPTDPVLAGDIGVGPPGDEDEHEPNFSVTGEAGLNDGLAYPFVLLGVVVALGDDGPGYLDWFLADVLYAIVVGIGLGALAGYAIAALAVRLRDRRLLSSELDGWLAPTAVLAIYGLTEIAGAYGFLAAFAGGVAFRRYEREHEVNARVHEGAEVAEKFGELALILLLGSSLTLAGLGAPGLSGWLLVPLLLVVIRPLSVLLSFVGSSMGPGERSFVAWFGVRGIGTIYYVAVVAGLGVLSADELEVITWTAMAAIVASIVAHGISATPLSRRWLPPAARPGKP